LNTIADYDKIMVMAGGRIVEVGEPWVLLEQRGIFSSMVARTGDNAVRIRDKAKHKFEMKLKMI